MPRRPFFSTGIRPKFDVNNEVQPPPPAALSWTDPSPPLPNITIAPNGYFDFEPYIIRKDLLGSITLQAGDTIPAHLTLPTVAPWRLTADSSANPGDQTLNVNFVLNGNAAADWNTRSTAAGVIWAQRFGSGTDISRYIDPGSSSNIFVNSADGIIGDGCMEMNFPAGALAQYSWSRPLFPITGDVNVAGLSVLPDIYGTIYPGMFNQVALGGHFVNPTYANGAFSNEPGKTAYHVYGGGFWMQYRTKFHNRFTASEYTGKLFILSTNHNQNDANIVMEANTALDGYGNGRVDAYLNRGARWNSKMTEPQRAQGGQFNGDKLQPGSNATVDPITGVPVNYLNTCVVGAGVMGSTQAWEYKPDTWITVMIHVFPGHHCTVQTLNDPANAACHDTIFEIFAALPGDVAWTRVYSKSDYQVNFDQDDNQPFGYNWMTFTPHSTGASSVNGYSIKYDQIICSLQQIALPLV